MGSGGIAPSSPVPPWTQVPAVVALVPLLSLCHFDLPFVAMGVCEEGLMGGGSNEEAMRWQPCERKSNNRLALTLV